MNIQLSKQLLDAIIAAYNKENAPIEASDIDTLVLDEIFSLNPVTRARMMKSENRDLYSKEQQREIEKLEKRLLIKDADALQKVQDIALLTQRNLLS